MKNEIICYLVFSIILLLISYYLIFFKFNNLNQFDEKFDEKFDVIAFSKINQNNRNQLKWSRNKCNYIMNETILNELKANGIYESQTDWNLLFPCSYDNIQSEVNMMPIIKGAKYFILENCDNIVAKELLWKYVVDHYDYPIAKTMMPNSYILYDKSDIDRFTKEHDDKKIYIMKKNIQRQEGLKITKDKNEILDGFKNGGYVIVQELLQNPYTISKRKTNMRFYILVVCKENDMNVFVYKDGFMYYTKDEFTIGSIDEGPNITTGYIDRSVYETNPLTHSDLKVYLDDPNRELSQIEKSIKNQGLKISEIYFNRIYHLIRQIFTAVYGQLTKSNKFDKTNTMFQLFGADIAVDNKLNPTIMEINKGPDLGAKDQRDLELKKGVVRNMLKVIGTLQSNSCNDTMYLKVLDITNGIINNDNKNNCSL